MNSNASVTSYTGARHGSINPLLELEVITSFNIQRYDESNWRPTKGTAYDHGASTTRSVGTLEDNDILAIIARQRPLCLLHFRIPTAINEPWSPEVAQDRKDYCEDHDTYDRADKRGRVCQHDVVEAAPTEVPPGLITWTGV